MRRFTFRRSRSSAAGHASTLPRTILTASLLVLGTALLADLISRLHVVEKVELSLLDLRFRFRGPIPHRDEIVIVTIDQTSESDLDQAYPWDRRLHGRLVDNLGRAGARLVVFDVVFTEGADSAATASFADAIGRAGNVILAGKTEETRLRARAHAIYPPLPRLAENAWGWGRIDQYGDIDNAVRRYGLTTTFSGREYATLAVQTLKAYQGLPPDAPVTYDDGVARVGSYEIPRYDRQTMLINYAGPAGTFSQYSFSSVLDDSSFDLPREEADLDIFDLWLARGVFRDKIVLVGYTGRELHDFIHTPFFGSGQEKVLTPGVEMHANAISTMLGGRFISRPGTAVKGFRLLLALRWAGLPGVVATRLGVVPGLLCTLAFAVGEIALAFWLFRARDWWIEITTPTLATAMAYTAQTARTVIAERRAKRQIRGMFQHYVPPQVVDQLIRRPELLALGGEERELTVMFTDIEGFTTISETLKPSDLANHLNSYLTAMSEIVLRHRGIVDKFEGDAIMAEFGAPVPFSEHAREACLAALEMQRRLRELGREWERAGLHPWRSRVGVHTGNVIVGNMGSSTLFDYTVIGDNVNLGARLEAANKIYGTRIMVSEATLREAGPGFIARELDDIVVKGRTHPVKVFELVAGPGETLPPDQERALAIYHRGLEAARETRWEEAAARFEEAITLAPEDGPSRYHRLRVADLTAIAARASKASAGGT